MYIFIYNVYFFSLLNVNSKILCMLHQFSKFHIHKEQGVNTEHWQANRS
jgi:hypothetical protein